MAEVRSPAERGGDAEAQLGLGVVPVGAGQHTASAARRRDVVLGSRQLCPGQKEAGPFAAGDGVAWRYVEGVGHLAEGLVVPARRLAGCRGAGGDEAVAHDIGSQGPARVPLGSRSRPSASRTRLASRSATVSSSAGQERDSGDRGGHDRYRGGRPQRRHLPGRGHRGHHHPGEQPRQWVELGQREQEQRLRRVGDEAEARRHGPPRPGPQRTRARSDRPRQEA